MDKQTIADELASLAGWKYGSMTDPAIEGLARGWSKGARLLLYGQHPFPVGSLDALEAFRREKLPGWEWDHIHNVGGPVGWRVQMSRGEIVYRWYTGPDEWTARASALIAAAKENKP